MLEARLPNPRPYPRVNLRPSLPGHRKDNPNPKHFWKAPQSFFCFLPLPGSLLFLYFRFSAETRSAPDLVKPWSQPARSAQRDFFKRAPSRWGTKALRY